MSNSGVTARTLIGDPPKRKRKADWLLDQDPTDVLRWAVKKAATEERGGYRRKRRRTSAPRRRRYSRRMGSRGGCGGRDIIYPNIVGRGAYFLGGGFGYDSEKGFSAFGKGYITDQQVSGSGAYTVRQNSLLSMGQDPPAFANISRDNVVIVKHREYIGELTCDTGAPSPFKLEDFTINPGNSKLFPWLSQLAKLYQEWEPLGIIFELKTECSDYAQNVSLGSIFGAVEYNVLQAVPADKMHLEQLEHCTSAKASQSLLVPVECAPKLDAQTHLYIAIDEDYLTGDPRLYDLGRVMWGSQGMPNSGSVIGNIAEIWVTYEIAFFKPQLLPDEEIDVDALSYMVFANPTSAANYQVPYPLGNADGGFILSGFNNLACELHVDEGGGNNTTLTFPVDAVNDLSYTVILYCQVNGQGNVPQPGYTIVGGSCLDSTSWGANAAANFEAAQGSGKGMLGFSVKVPAGNTGKVQLTTTALSDGQTWVGSQLRVTKCVNGH